MTAAEVERSSGVRCTFKQSRLETTSPTYNQLLALAERSAQQSIRTQRKTYSSVISRRRGGRSGRAENNPEVNKGSAVRKRCSDRVRRRLLIHRPASRGSSTGEARSVSRPSLCQSALRRDGERGSTGMLKKKIYTITTVEPLGLTRTFFCFTDFPSQLRINVSRDSARRDSEIKTQSEREFSGGSSSSLEDLLPLWRIFLLSRGLSPEARSRSETSGVLLSARRGLSDSPRTHAHSLSVNTHGPSSHTTASR